MQVLVVEFRIHAAFVSAFEAAITENACASVEREPGCRQFDVCRDPKDASLFFLYEVYEDDEAIEAHMRSPHFQSMDSATREWVMTKTVRRLIRGTPDA